MTSVSTSNRPQNIDIKLLHAKKQQAEMRRNQKEEDLRENHPFFDRPLFAVPRESYFRKLCQKIKNAKYDTTLKDPVTGKERKIRFKTMHKLLGLVTYLDWIMIFITTLTGASMMAETPQFRVMDNTILQVMDYVFVVGMGMELFLKASLGCLFTKLFWAGLKLDSCVGENWLSVRYDWNCSTRAELSTSLTKTPN